MNIELSSFELANFKVYGCSEYLIKYKTYYAVHVENFKEVLDIFWKPRELTESLRKRIAKVSMMPMTIIRKES